MVEQFRVEAQNQDVRYVFRDYSVEDSFDASWKLKAERIIRSSSAVLCFIGRRTYQSEPVDWEIQRSIELGKPVVTVYAVDEELPLPRALRKHCITPVHPKIQDILRAIEKATS